MAFAEEFHWAAKAQTAQTAQDVEKTAILLQAVSLGDGTPCYDGV